MVWHMLEFRGVKVSGSSVGWLSRIVANCEIVDPDAQGSGGSLCLPPIGVQGSAMPYGRVDP